MTIDLIPFAVDLSNDGIFLWHRKLGQKWEFLGSVPLNSGNLRQQLDTLKIKAEAIDAPSNDTIVRIPLSEVRTLSVVPQPNTSTGWEVLIVAELEKAAGQPINELAFDFDRFDGGEEIKVAWTTMAVVKQAQTFVNLIGFKPTFYTTDIDPSIFPRRPNFLLVEELVTPETLSQEPTIEDPHPYPTFKDHVPPLDGKNGKFSAGWFVALVLILILVLCAIYFGPQIMDAVQFGFNSQTNAPNFAIA